MQRDYFIDVIKGITIINIVIIHTIYHSGGEFPVFLKNFVLLADVPIFFLCSGLTSSGNIKKTIIRLFKLQLSFMLFISIVFIISSIYTQDVSWGLFFDNISHDYKTMPPFHSVNYSLWYIKAYFIIAVIGSIIIHFASTKLRIDIILSILFLGILYSSFQGYILDSIYISIINFYLFIFLLGFRLKDINISKQVFSGTILIVLFCLFFWFFIANQSKLIQIYKFPPHIIYLLISAVGLSTIIFLRRKVKISPKNIFIYPGRNSLFFYFAQGIGGSLTLGVVIIGMQHSLKWYLIFLLALILNLTVTCILAPFLKYCDSLMWKTIHIVMNKTRKSVQ
ncbi:acyltransferase family protein [Dysgonomonas sp. HGC4]|uniref:acyltransferase family protein n=1 Tax=Dysgonomonas sp. HGC4 TaxID=1658009 RepID=UPI0006828DCA|nr:acyltransferase family protein [Dysgonomonas sp. HGC4]MBD8348894.1 acyltransferase family protein [Dysgonomonas sp. HGC4]